MSIKLTDELEAATKKGKLASAKQVYLEGDQETLQQIGDKTHQLENTIKDISTTGGASTANAVSYNNETSGMTAVNAQAAIDELASKNKAQDAEIAKKANDADVTSKMQTEQTRVNEELAKKFDKSNIAQELGDSEDKVVSQFALPFREIESPEFLKLIIDANDKILFSINLDGFVDWGKGIPAPIRAKLQEIINQSQQDKTDLLAAINAAKEELSTALQEYKSTTDASITSLQQNKVDKEDGKSLIDDEVKEHFSVVENEEWLCALTDAENRVLFGIYRDTGKPYYPLNDMYHVEQNEEFFAVWLDADNHVLLGIRRDGQIIGEIHAVNALKHVIAKIQEVLASLQDKVTEHDGSIKSVNDSVSTIQGKVATIESNLQEFLSVFSLQDNPEYLAAETDAEGKVLSATNPDGSHYIHKVKSETIDNKVDKEDGKSLINSDVADSQSTIEDPEGRMEITTDADNKVIGYRDKEGTRHEYKISTKHLELTDDAAKEVNEAFKSAGIKMENPSDFSKDSYIELPIPRISAQVRLYASKLPTSKQDDIEATIEYSDKDGNYFKKPVILNAQGSSSMSYYVKNMAIDLNDGSEIKFGDFPTQDSFHLKKYYIDAFRGQCIVGYWLTEQVYKTRPIGEQYPYEYLQKFESTIDSNGSFKNDNFTGAKCHPDGFPIVITWVNTNTNKETEMGVYAWNLKKSKEVYNMDKKTAKHIILDGEIGRTTMFGGTVNWSSFEIRNPKSLIDIDGKKYDGDNPKELSDTDKLSSEVKKYITRLSEAYPAILSSKTKENFEKYFLVNPFIDYWLVSSILYNLDGFNKNWIWCSWDGEHFAPTLYDLDSIFGQHTTGTFVIRESETNLVGRGNPPVNLLIELYNDEIKARYKVLRDKGVFSVENIVSLLGDWLGKIGYDNLKNDLNIFNETPSYRNSYLSDKWDIVTYNWGTEQDNYDNEKTYNVGDQCNYKGFKFKVLQQTTGEVPVSNVYDKLPYLLGFHNSLQRVKNWLTAKIKSLDENYEYNV